MRGFHRLGDHARDLDPLSFQIDLAACHPGHVHKWKPASGQTVKDDIVVYEVMVDALDRAWWADYRKALEKRLGEQELVVRALPMERL